MLILDRAGCCVMALKLFQHCAPWREERRDALPQQEPRAGQNHDKNNVR